MGTFDFTPVAASSASATGSSTSQSAATKINSLPIDFAAILGGQLAAAAFEVAGEASLVTNAKSISLQKETKKKASAEEFMASTWQDQGITTALFPPWSPPPIPAPLEQSGIAENHALATESLSVAHQSAGRRLPGNHALQAAEDATSQPDAGEIGKFTENFAGSPPMGASAPTLGTSAPTIQTKPSSAIGDRPATQISTVREPMIQLETDQELNDASDPAQALAGTHVKTRSDTADLTSQPSVLIRREGVDTTQRIVSPNNQLANTTQSDTAIVAAEQTATKPPEATPAANMLAASPSSPRAADHMPPAPISTPLQNERWPQEFGDRVLWMAKSDQHVAHISITPAQLGPIQITINLSGDQATAIFASPHAEVRQAIQDALPQLREMLAATGISLGQSNVGAQLPQQQRESAAAYSNENPSRRENDILSQDSHLTSRSAGSPIQRGRGLVDLFA